MMEQGWFEMARIRERPMDRGVWVTLRQCQDSIEEGEFGHLGYREEHEAAGTVAILQADRVLGERLDWGDLGVSHYHTGRIADDGTYLPADIFESGWSVPPPKESLAARALRAVQRRPPPEPRPLRGVNLVIEQMNEGDRPEWHLNQDLVVSLGLIREGDKWVRPEGAFEIVSELYRRDDGAPRWIRILNSYLKDYLCARDMVMRVSLFRSRTEVTETRDHISWPENQVAETSPGIRWQGRLQEIHEGGFSFGSGISIFRAARVDVDTEAEVPVFDAATGIRSSRFTHRHAGRRLFHISGEMWKEEWIEPGTRSPIVRRDEVPGTIEFVTDAAGTRETEDTLPKGGLRWLWFQPGVADAILAKRGGFLTWHTRETGTLACKPSGGVHFGINELGLLNVVAKDIAMLPDWQQQIWSSFNVPPSGGVSQELMTIQNGVGIPTTVPPEAVLEPAIEALQQAGFDVFGIRIIRKHDVRSDIYKRAHRLRVTDRATLFSLAKDLARLTSDSIDAKAIHPFLNLAQGDNPGSLKSLERLVALRAGGSDAADVMRPLFGTQELRQADAHLPGSDIPESLAKVRIDTSQPFVMQGETMLRSCVDAIIKVRAAILS